MSIGCTIGDTKIPCHVLGNAFKCLNWEVLAQMNFCSWGLCESCRHRNCLDDEEGVTFDTFMPIRDYIIRARPRLSFLENVQELGMKPQDDDIVKEGGKPALSQDEVI
jgi:hypothetical protein